MTEQIEAVLASLRPMLALHRGNIELVSYDEEAGIVTVKFLGMCAGCPLSAITLHEGIEEELRHRIPGVKTVVAVSD